MVSPPYLRELLLSPTLRWGSKKISVVRMGVYGCQSEHLMFVSKVYCVSHARSCSSCVILWYYISRLQLLHCGTRPYHAQLCHASRLAGEWSVAEGVLTALIAACQGNEKICRRLLRAGLDELIDAAEDNIKGTTPKITLSLGGAAATSVLNPAIKSPGNGRSAPSDATSRRGLGTNTELGLDQIDEIGVDGVLREGASALAQNIQREAMENCSALATSLLQTLGPFNYVSFRCRFELSDERRKI